MAITNNETIKYKNKTSKRQTIWNYIRRNRTFRVGDVMMICEVNYNYMQKFLRFLLKANYIRHDNKHKPYSDRRYTLLKNTGAIAPLITDYGLYDNNIQKAIEFVDTQTKQKIYTPDVLIKILKSISYTETTKQNLIDKASVKKGALTKWWKRLQKFGVILQPIESTDISKKRWKSDYTPKYKRDNNLMIYQVDQERAKEVLQELEKGAYTHVNSQMRQLWIKQ